MPPALRAPRGGLLAQPHGQPAVPPLGPQQASVQGRIRVRNPKAREARREVQLGCGSECAKVARLALLDVARGGPGAASRCVGCD